MNIMLAVSDVPYLIEANVHHRSHHGLTHGFRYAETGAQAFDLIILKDLVEYLSDPERGEEYQRSAYNEDS